MGTAKEKYPTFVSPALKLTFAFLNKPRQYQGKGDFAYSCQANLTGQDAADLEKFVGQQIEEAKQRFKTRKVANSPISEAEDEDGKAIPDTITVKFKVSATMEVGGGRTWDRKPAFFDAAGKPIQPEPSIGPGTVCKVSYQVYLWKTGNGAGVTLQPQALQITELVEFKPRERDAEGYGFAPTEGYTAPPVGEGEESGIGDDCNDGGEGQDF